MTTELNQLRAEKARGCAARQAGIDAMKRKCAEARQLHLAGMRPAEIAARYGVDEAKATQMAGKGGVWGKNRRGWRKVDIERCRVLLESNRTIAQVATELGVSETTVYRYWRELGQVDQEII